MGSFRQLIHEIHRRSLWQVLAIYAVASWVIYQVVLGLWEGIGLPSWVPGTALVLLLIGLPVVLATAFVEEGAPGRSDARGSTRDPETPAPTANAAPTTRAAPTPHAAPDDEPGVPRDPSKSNSTSKSNSLFTWSRAITGGVLAFAALGLAAAGFMGMRALGIGPAATLISSGELEARQPLVVADFDGITGDTLLATVVAEALRADLAQSSSIRVADRARIRETLERMLLPPDAALDPATAREVATRMGLKGVVEGEIGRAGAGYVLTARLVTADSGRTLATFRETAADSVALVGAIEHLSRSMRERIGESLRSVRQSEPLAAVTTPSLPALRLWAQATVEERRNNDRRRAIRLAERAVELDTAFAAAWHLLGVMHYNSNRRAATLDAVERALEHQDRLSEAARHTVRAFYASVTGDLSTAMAEQRERIAMQEDSTGYVGLSDMAWNAGNFAAAEEYAQIAVDRPNPGWVSYWNLWVAQMDQGKIDASHRTAQRAVEALPEVGSVRALAYYQAWIEGDYQTADTLFEAGSRPWRRLRYLRGRLHEVERQMGDDLLPVLHATFAMLLKNDPTATNRITRWVTDSLPDDAWERGIAEAGLALAMHGRSDAARAARAAYEARVPPPVRWKDDVILHAIDGFLALDEGRTDDAFAALRRARRSTPWTAQADAFIGRAYDMAGRPDSAIAAYTRYLETPWSYRAGEGTFLADPVLLVPTHERLALLHEERGDLEAATRHAARVVELWSEADPELQPRVEAMRRILGRASEERGGQT